MRLQKMFAIGVLTSLTLAPVACGKGTGTDPSVASPWGWWCHARVTDMFGKRVAIVFPMNGAFGAKWRCIGNNPPKSGPYGHPNLHQQDCMEFGTELLNACGYDTFGAVNVDHCMFFRENDGQARMQGQMAKKPGKSSCNEDLIEYDEETGIFYMPAECDIGYVEELACEAATCTTEPLAGDVCQQCLYESCCDYLTACTAPSEAMPGGCACRLECGVTSAANCSGTCGPEATPTLELTASCVRLHCAAQCPAFDGF